jgi:hypothetical protein
MPALRNHSFRLANSPSAVAGFSGSALARYKMRQPPSTGGGAGKRRRLEAMPTRVAQKRTQAAEIIGTRKLVRAPENASPTRQGKAEPAISSAFRPSRRVPYPGQAALAARICRAANRAKPARKPTKTDFVEHHHLRPRGESQTPIDDSKHVSSRHRGVVTAGRPVRPGAVQAREETLKPYQALAGFQELGADGGGRTRTVFGRGKAGEIK